VYQKNKKKIKRLCPQLPLIPEASAFRQEYVKLPAVALSKKTHGNSPIFRFKKNTMICINLKQTALNDVKAKTHFCELQ